MLNCHKIVKNLNLRWITTKLSKTWIGLILILYASDHSAVTCGQMGGSWIHTWLQNMYARLHWMFGNLYWSYMLSPEMQFLINILVLSASGRYATPFKGYEWLATCGQIALKLIPPYTNLRHNQILACTFPKNYHTTKKGCAMISKPTTVHMTKKGLCDNFKTKHCTKTSRWWHN